jgi:hypothetical protein
MSSFSFDEDMTEIDRFPAVFDVLAFATNAFINALVDDTDRRHELAHFINERAIFLIATTRLLSNCLICDGASRGFTCGRDGGECIVEVV